MLNADALVRLTKENTLRHAYVFFGPPGGGKAQCAETLARLLEHGVDASLLPLQDTLLIEPEGEHIAIETIRAVKKFLSVTPAASLRRTVIVKDAERITWAATPALLKIVEEPPPQGLIILIAKNLHSLPPALLSRLARIYFRPSDQKPVLPAARPADEKTSLASRIETAIIKLYLENPMRHASEISRLLQTLEAATRYNLNEKIQAKALAL